MSRRIERTRTSQTSSAQICIQHYRILQSLPSKPHRMFDSCFASYSEHFALLLPVVATFCTDAQTDLSEGVLTVRWRIRWWFEICRASSPINFRTQAAEIVRVTFSPLIRCFIAISTHYGFISCCLQGACLPCPWSPASHQGPQESQEGLPEWL